MKWIKIEEKLPPKNTLVWVKRFSNKIENAPIYLAMRNSCEISTNIDLSKNCYWYGINKKEINKEQESTNYFTFILKIFVILLGSTNISCIFVKEITTKTIEIMTTTGNIITKTYGQNTFTFNVGEIITKKGSKKFCFVEQVTEFNAEDNKIFGFDMPNAVTNWKFYFDVLTTEFGAINLAGKKLIKNWENI